MWVIHGSLKRQKKNQLSMCIIHFFFCIKNPYLCLNFMSQYNYGPSLSSNMIRAFLFETTNFRNQRFRFAFACFFKQVSAMICANPNVKVQNLTFAITNECVKFCLERISKSIFFGWKISGNFTHRLRLGSLLLLFTMGFCTSFRWESSPDFWTFNVCWMPFCSASAWAYLLVAAMGYGGCSWSKLFFFFSVIALEWQYDMIIYMDLYGVTQMCTYTLNEWKTTKLLVILTISCFMLRWSFSLPGNLKDVDTGCENLSGAVFLEMVFGRPSVPRCKKRRCCSWLLKIKFHIDIPDELWKTHWS